MLFKIIFWPIKLVLRLLLWVLLLPFNILLAPVKLALRVLQLLLFVGLAAAIVIIVLVARGDI